MPKPHSLARRDLMITLGRRTTLSLGKRIRLRRVVADTLHLDVEDDLFATLALTEDRQERVAIYASGWDALRRIELLNRVVRDAGLPERVISYDAGTFLVFPDHTMRPLGEAVWVGGILRTVNGHPVREKVSQ